jgi:hypothetical protein
MKTKTNIKVENPCPFLLYRMNKNGNDYFCKSCSKTVVDFRDKTEEEIKCLAYKDTCGVFTIDQLKGQQKQSISMQIIFYVLTVLSFLGFNVKPLTAQTIDTIKTKTETVTSEGSNKKDKKFETDEVTKTNNKNDKKTIFRRKKKKQVIIGCPSF